MEKIGALVFLRDLEMKEATYEREGGEKTWKNQNQES